MAVPTPVPEAAAPVAETGPAMGSLFDSYDPQGALDGLFVPAYIKGFQPSETAVAKWQAENHALSPAMLDQTRMPGAWQPPQAATSGMGLRAGGGSVATPYGPVTPTNANFGDPRGAVDPEALRVLAQGGKYDIAARRNAIAERVLANTAAEQAYNRSTAANPLARTLGESPSGGFYADPNYYLLAAGG